MINLPPPRILFFEERTIPARIRARLVIGALMLLYRLRFWRTRSRIRPVAGLTAEDRRTYQLARRFALGATAGFLASKYSYGWWGSLRLNLLHADAFGHWSSFLITADAAMDSTRMSRPASVDLLRACFHALIEPVQAIDIPFAASSMHEQYLKIFGTAWADRRGNSALIFTGENRFSRFAETMASIVGEKLAAIASRHCDAGRGRDFAIGLEEFYVRTLNLIDGQLNSIDQLIVDEEHDWGWYRDVLNSKSMDVLLTLLSLFVSSARRRQPAENMKSCFYLVNRTFFHRQVLDDLLDIVEDIGGGTANSVVYMIVSQGRIAASCAQGDYLIRKNDIVQEVERSCLLGPEFGAARTELVERFKNRMNAETVTSGEIEAFVREALVNRESDRDIPVPELVKRCARRQQSLLIAWHDKAWDKVLEIVRESGIAARILNSIVNRKEQGEVEIALRSLNDEGVREVMHLFYDRTLHTYEKCLFACRSYL